MKKVLKSIIFAMLIAFTYCITDVNAILAGGPHEYYEFGNDIIYIDQEELNVKYPNGSYKYDGSYIIGTHMFTYEGNEEYDGILTTKHIMLAASTIGKYTTPTIDDMKVYYVDGNKLTDAFTGSEYNDFNIGIENIDLKKVDLGFTDLEMDVPELYLDDTIGMGSVSGYTDPGERVVLTITEIEDADFYKLFVAEDKDGLYMSDSNKITKDNINHIIYNVPYGVTLYFKAKACNEEKEMCSDWSNVVSYTAVVPEPDSPFGNMGSSGYTDEGMELDGIHYVNGIDGIEIYSSNDQYSGYKKILTKEKETDIIPSYFEINHVESIYDEKYDYWYSIVNTIESYETETEFKESPYYSTSLKDCDNTHLAFNGYCYKYNEERESSFIEIKLLTKKDEVKFYKARYYVIDSKGNKHYSKMSVNSFLINPVSIDENLGTPTIEYAYSYSNLYGNEIRGYKTDTKYEFVKVYIQEIGTDNPASEMILECDQGGQFEINAMDIPEHSYISIRGIDIKDGKTTMSSLSDTYEEHLNIAD